MDTPNPHSVSSALQILITQKSSISLSQTYARLTKQYGACIDFQACTEAELISIPLFRIHKPTICTHTALLFTNKTAIDGFFKLAKACSIEMPITTKYFFATEQLRHYVQKYVEVKKRKVFYGEQQLEDLFPIMHRHKKERFLFPCSDTGKQTIRAFFKAAGYHYTEIPIYSNRLCKLDDLDPTPYDIIVFFSPLTVQAFAKSFPQHVFGKTKVAAFSEKTIQAVKILGWPLVIEAPTQAIASMIDGLDHYLKQLANPT